VIEDQMVISLDIPESLAEKARLMGLLDADGMAKMLRTEIERREALKDFGSIVDKLHNANIPPMTDEEIRAEIKAARAERRACAENHR
jgi:hypothetical protein